MSAEKRNSTLINLIPGQKLDDSTGGKVIQWLLSTFRAIVILVQIVVIASFAGRVFVDTRLASLNKEIDDKHALVKSFGEIEKDFLAKKQKLETYSSLQLEGNQFDVILTAVANEIPNNVQLISIEKNEGNLLIKARTNQESMMYIFANRLNEVELITNAGVIEIQQDSTTNLISEFTISASVPSLTTNTTS